MAVRGKTLQPFGSVVRDSIQDVAIDADGDVYLAGYASGAYLDVVHADGLVAFALTTPRRFGEASCGSFEGRVVVVDAESAIEWDEVITSPEAVWVYAVAFTPSAGVAVVGETLGAIPSSMKTPAASSTQVITVWARWSGPASRPTTS